MKNFLRFSGSAAAALVFATFAPSAVAQGATTVWACQEVGMAPPEPLGDREGHSISVSQLSCRAESGPLSGGVSTVVGIWEWNGANGVELSLSGVNRKPGATLVYRGTEGKLTLTMTNGKETGWTGSGRGTNVLATGGWASMAGKSFTWTAKSVGPASQFSVEIKPE